MIKRTHRDSAPRVVLSGGPGGGKTTACDLFFREIGGHAVAVVPEAATLLFQAGLPRSAEPHALKAVQEAIYHLQRNLEHVQAALYPERVLMCDRGTLDGAAYWPDGPDDFFTAMGTTLEQELARYEAVIFFESAAAGGMSILGNNPTRNEGQQQALHLDRGLHALWSQHPNFVMVPHNSSFFKKITYGLASMESIVDQLSRQLEQQGEGDIPTP